MFECACITVRCIKLFCVVFLSDVFNLLGAENNLSKNAQLGPAQTEPNTFSYFVNKLLVWRFSVDTISAIFGTQPFLFVKLPTKSALS